MGQGHGELRDVEPREEEAEIDEEEADADPSASGTAGVNEESMRFEIMWAIRDNRDLNASEKALLWAVESRGAAYGVWDTVAADAGMSKNSFYVWRKRLMQKGHLVATERPGTTTVYRVSKASLVQGDPQTREGGLPESGNGVSADRVMKEDPQEDPQEDLLHSNTDDVHPVCFAKPSHHTPHQATIDWDAWEEDMTTDVWFQAQWRMDMNRLYREHHLIAPSI